MSDVIIKVDGLGKRYIISHEQQRGGYTALRDVISSKAKNVLKKREQLPAKEEFWALKDLSFEIKKGEAVGIIGRNGAGKSTLLKILSRITEPTTGRIELNGRVASLLEVGTGFHPELTGRENIFLNGAILGMGRAEIKNKFDEIVDFSGVEKFLDTPVKRYSSGMYVRLAFAVAAHLEPEILVVDEVLAVGDAEFQKKCLGKMDEVSKKEGRTVLFVSHQFSAIRGLCNRALLLNNGKYVFQGEVNKAINIYMSNNEESKLDAYVRTTDDTNDFFFSKIKCNTNIISSGDDLILEIEYNSRFIKKEMVVNIMVQDTVGDLLAHIINADDLFLTANANINTLKVKLKRVNFPAGKYYLNFWAGYDMNLAVEYLPKALSFEINENSPLIKRTATYPANSKIIIQSEWSGE